MSPPPTQTHKLKQRERKKSAPTFSDRCVRALAKMLRSLLLLAGAAATASAARLSAAQIASIYPRQPAPPAPIVLRAPRDAAQSLRDAGAAKGLFIGAAINVAGITTEPVYADIAQREFSLTTAENECKVGPVHPTETTWTTQQCEQLAIFTAANQSVFRNHNLCAFPPTHAKALARSRGSTPFFARAQTRTVSLARKHAPASGQCSETLSNSIRGP